MSLKTSKVALLLEPGRIEIDERLLPDVGDEGVLLRIERAGLCGTDYKIFVGGMKSVFPIMLGHEILGRIEQIGDVVAAREHLAVGDRVVVEANVPCATCAFCKDGQSRFCRTTKHYGFGSPDIPPYRWGAFSEVMYLAPGSQMTKVSEKLSAAAAVVAASTLANGIRWMRTVGGAEIGKPVVIQGVGAQGLAGVIAAKESGAFPIIATGLTVDAARMQLARELGADVCIDVQREDVVSIVREVTDGKFASTVLDVTGSPQAIALSIDLVRTMGTVVCASSVAGDGAAPIKTNALTSKEVSFQGVWTHPIESTRQALKLAESGRYPLEKFISHDFPLDEAERAVRSIGREIAEIDPIKVSLTP